MFKLLAHLQQEILTILCARQSFLSLTMERDKILNVEIKTLRSKQEELYDEKLDLEKKCEEFIKVNGKLSESR